MNIIHYESASFSTEAQEQKWKRILTPLLKGILDEGAEITIYIDKYGNLCINKVAIGKSDLISNFRVFEDILYYDYSNKTRLVDFSEIYDFFKPPRKQKIERIYEIQPNNTLRKLQVVTHNE